MLIGESDVETLGLLPQEKEEIILRCIVNECMDSIKSVLENLKQSEQFKTGNRTIIESCKYKTATQCDEIYDSWAGHFTLTSDDARDYIMGTTIGSKLPTEKVMEISNRIEKELSDYYRASAKLLIVEAVSENKSTHAINAAGCGYALSVGLAIIGTIFLIIFLASAFGG